MVIRFFLFASVGLIGTAVHLGVLALFHQWFFISFLISQAAATFIAMTHNYFLNNWLTFKQQRHQGKQQLKGLFSFYMSCSVGALVNLECANLLYQAQVNWALAGLLAGLSGVLCNFVAATLFTWKTYNYSKISK
jgi:dolichol-phosphate mannosyltransferase